jgi:hypothetical protein
MLSYTVKCTHAECVPSRNVLTNPSPLLFVLAEHVLGRHVEVNLRRRQVVVAEHLLEGGERDAFADPPECSSWRMARNGSVFSGFRSKASLERAAMSGRSGMGDEFLGEAAVGLRDPGGGIVCENGCAAGSAVLGGDREGHGGL